ncbi:MAG TPA: MTAP family purine nucleoside phosphorylase [Solirubrobacterales bacterium]|jgi:5'-methylthioadenosine phosphorylase|nr:MTAP family purine nucleoside phosphorylase [Solirubrobacterales bacterium]
MDPPSVTGERLAVVYGHSLPPGRLLDDLLGDGGATVFLAWHGRERFAPAHRVDDHANIRALCELGCDRVLALASTGSLRPEIGVGTLVCPDDFLALGVAPTFFDDARGHSVPGFDPLWRERVVGTWASRGAQALRDGGVYAHVAGPRFETAAEVRVLARDADVVGMTIAAEAILAREAGLAYAAVCTVDNMANGLDAAPLSVEEYRRARDAFAPLLVADLGRVLPALAAGGAATR